ncbi:MAG: TlpA family protein disulfide reductase [Bacteriovoracaceae bacterium]
MNTKVLIVLALLLLSGSYILFNSQKLKQLSQTEITTSLVTELPEMSVSTLEGTSVKLSDFYKQDKNLLLVHFWGSWCGPCETEFPSLVHFIEGFKESPYVFLLVAVSDKEVDIKKFLAKHPLPANALVLMDLKDQYLEKFGAAKVPETFVFNQGKKLVKHFLGPQDWSQPYLTDLFKGSFK